MEKSWKDYKLSSVNVSRSVDENYKLMYIDRVGELVKVNGYSMKL